MLCKFIWWLRSLLQAPVNGSESLIVDVLQWRHMEASEKLIRASLFKISSPRLSKNSPNKVGSFQSRFCARRQKELAYFRAEPYPCYRHQTQGVILFCLFFRPKVFFSNVSIIASYSGKDWADSQEQEQVVDCRQLKMGI